MVWQKLVNCCTIRKQQIARLFVAEATTCLARGLLIDFNSLEMCRCLFKASPREHCLDDLTMN